MKRLMSVLLIAMLLVPTMALAETPASYGESPLLAAEVQAGALPPVEKRLPKEPYVSKAADVGQYGGTFRGAGFGPSSGQLDTEGMRFVGLLRVMPDNVTTEPFVLKSYDVNEDFSEYILHLREGMKWSDGEPFTADDFVFWYETICMDDSVANLLKTGVSGRTMFKNGDEVTGKIEKVDDATVKVSFTKPMPSFQVKMQKGNPNNWIWAAKHYLEKWHPAYNPDAEKLAKEEGFESWQQCFERHSDRGQTGTDFGPDITPFVMYKIDQDGNKYFKRNPYYFAVDREGNQLPYIDEQMCVIVADAQTRTLKLINGELDAAGENPLPVSDYTLYKENEDKGNYNVFLFDNSRGSDAAFTFTQTLKDETLKSLFTSVKFREAMSLAIDRDAINETLYFGLATVRQAVPPANTSFYEDWMGSYMTEYDPEGAAARLDELGCPLQGDVRLMPSGQPFNIILESTEEFAKVGEMVAEMWTAVGVKTTFKQQERTFARERYATNEREAQVFTFDNVAEPSLIAETFDKIYPPFGVNIEIGQAPLWNEWYQTGGKSGEEPPENVQKLRTDIDKMVTLKQGSDEYLALGKEILTDFTKNLYFIGCTVAPRIIILNRDLGNTPTGGIFANDYNFWYPFNCDAWYFKA